MRVRENFRLKENEGFDSSNLFLIFPGSTLFQNSLFARRPVKGVINLVQRANKVKFQGVQSY